MPLDWTDDDVERYLDDFPLPADFTATRVERTSDGEKILTPNSPVRPSHHGKRFGKWLRDTPYFPGLFERARDIIRAVPVDGRLPTPEELAAKLRDQAAPKQPTLF